MGINALYAAHIGLAAINALRETFRDEDTIRVHPIITHGGSQVNVIPGEVLSNARPPMTPEQYLAFQRGLARREVYEG
jgi:metal-dependent amidase/aminoacylase/carboxypeptidase family protein